MAKTNKPTLEASIVAVAGGKEFVEIQKQQADAIRALRAEARLAQGEDKKRALAALAELKKYKKVRGAQNLDDRLAKDLLRAIAQTRQKTAEVIRQNSKTQIGGKQSRGTDGKTMTERMRDEQQELASRDKIVELLANINEHKAKADKGRELISRQLKTTLRQGLSAFLGPAGPLIETFAELKDEYGDEAKDMAKRFVKWIKGDKDLVAALEKNGKQEQSRSKRLLSVLNDGFKRLGSNIGSGLMSLLGWAWKSSWALAKKIAQPLIRGVVAVASKLGPMAAKVLPKLGAGAAGLAKGLGKRALSIVPGLGAALGVYGLATTDEAKDTDSTGDKALAYGDGALSGAATGAAVGSFVPVLGTAVGAVLGAAGGLALTAVLRNKKQLLKTSAETWDKAGDVAKTGLTAATGYIGTLTSYVSSVMSDIREGFSALHTWLVQNVPFYGKAVAAVKAAPEAVKAAGKNVAAAAVGVANSAVTTAGQVSSSVGIAAQSAADAVSSKASSLGGSLPEGSAVKSIATGIGAASSSLSKFAGKLAKPSAEVDTALTEAAAKTGVDKGYMMAMTAQESGFNPLAKATTSSAKGLNQFIDGTWKSMVNKYGVQYGIGMKDQYDPKKNAMMGALFAKDNAELLQKQGHAPSATNLYAAHMLGSGGANTLLSAAKKDGGQAADKLFPAAAKANRNIFYNTDGSPKSVSQVVDFYRDKIETRAASYNKIDTATATASVAPVASGYERVAAQTPAANVTVNNGDSTGGGVNGNGAGQRDGSSSYGGANYSMTDMPFVLGDNNMVVVNAGMMGA